MKIRVSYILIILLVVLTTVWFLTKNNKTTINRSETDFSFKNVDQVTSISIEKNNEFVKLVKNNKNWLINNSEPANGNMIYAVIDVLSNIQMSSPVSEETRDILNDSIQKNGTILRLNTNNKVIYKLSFIKFNNRIVGLLKNKKPYYLSIRGRHTDFEKLFPVKPDYWKEKILINLTLDQILEIRLSYFDTPKHSFIINNNGKTTQLKDIYNSDISNIKAHSLTDYLQNFTGISYVAKDINELTIIKEMPDFELNLVTKTLDTTNIVAYQLYSNISHEADKRYFCGVLNSTDTLLLRYFDFDPIILNKDYFLKK